MKKIKVNMGTLIESISAFTNRPLIDNSEIDTNELNCKINTPSGFCKINYVIKKMNLPGVSITFTDDTTLKCANEHILFSEETPIKAGNVSEGTIIDTVSGNKIVSGITEVHSNDYYDVSIDAPHVYCDAEGILHHNTLITAALSKSVEKFGRSIVIVPNKSLVEQTAADYVNLGLDVGVYFGDRKEQGRTHTVCTWQSLNNVFKAGPLTEAEVTLREAMTEDVVALIVDEVHLATASVLQSLLTGIYANVPLRWGLTGTVPKEKMDQTALLVSLGPVTGKLAASELQDQGVLSNCHVNVIQLKDKVEYKDYQSELKHLLENQSRLDKIGELLTKISDTGNTLILVDRVKAGKELAARIPGAVFVNGSTKLSERKEEYDDVAVMDDKVIIATFGVASTGLNIPRIFNLVLIEPGKSFSRVIQSIGRGLRKAEDKDHVEIYDICSTCKFSKRHLTTRKAYYTESNYPFTVEKLDY